MDESFAKRFSENIWMPLLSNAIECEYLHNIQTLTATHGIFVVYIKFDLRWTHHNQPILLPLTVLVGIEDGSTLNYLEIYRF